MTTIVILLYGFGFVLIISAMESNPDGSNVSIIQTVKDIWDDKVNFSQATNQGSGPPNPTPSAQATVNTTAVQQGNQFASQMQQFGS